MDTPQSPSDAQPPLASKSLNGGTRLSKRLPPWLIKFAGGNPFYLLSAALLLYGIYRVTVDPKFLATESNQLIFNFTALQSYEALLAATAILLARRRIWSDATLLVKLEGLLVMAPFILLSHAVFLGDNLGRVLCYAGAGFAILRIGIVRLGFPNLHLPREYLVAGLLVLLVNTALPLVFRAGLDTNLEAWQSKHLLLWTAVLPALLALPNLLPHKDPPAAAPLGGRWLPMTLYLFWIIGTGVHLVCINYVDQVNYRKENALQPHLLTPSLWVLAWTLCFRFRQYLPLHSPQIRKALLLMPALAPLPALGHEQTLFFLALTALNIIPYTGIFLRRRDEPLPLHLALYSVAAVIASIPVSNTWGIFGNFDRGDWIAIGVIGLVLAEGFLVRTPKFAIGGAILLTLAALKLTAGLNYALQIAPQLGLVWFLLHSLCWDDRKEPHSSTVRTLASLAWTAHSWHCVYYGSGDLFVPWLALIALIGYGAARWLRIAPARLVILLAVLLSSTPVPSQSAAIQVRQMPTGVLALVSSFLLFGLGTAFAMWRSRDVGKELLGRPEPPPQES